ncbi:hypothetical protein TEA_011754 [Camellia sinensis var. sinensis]|uniref:Uncharacterized protein n=1 Tax=Camellia sinensis var. sinensis TaxID=542762 RepID=A0A4S4CW75_CAMSN|nr:hypothetical protein TEA_011754 [Camellia sinensis var. sinensis]
MRFEALGIGNAESAGTVAMRNPLLSLSTLSLLLLSLCLWFCVGRFFSLCVLVNLIWVDWEKKWLEAGLRHDREETFNNFGDKLSRKTVVHNWEETFNNFGDKLSRKTVVHNWLGGGVAERVVAAGLRCIMKRGSGHLMATLQRILDKSLEHFRCLLNQRGVVAAPLAGPSRVASQDPGSCYMQ